MAAAPGYVPSRSTDQVKTVAIECTPLTVAHCQQHQQHPGATCMSTTLSAVIARAQRITAGLTWALLTDVLKELKDKVKDVGMHVPINWSTTPPKNVVDYPDFSFNNTRAALWLRSLLARGRGVENMTPQRQRDAYRVTEPDFSDLSDTTAPDEPKQARTEPSAGVQRKHAAEIIMTASEPQPKQVISDMRANGVCVTRAAWSQPACAACLVEVLESLEQMLALPQTMAERMQSAAPTRHFLHIAASPAAAAVQEPVHRSDFKMALSPCVVSVLRATLDGEPGLVLVDALGPDAELCELTAITSEPGASSQPAHSDNHWSPTAPRLITVFVALHDVLDESLGPTHFWPGTHANPGGPRVWLRPTVERAAERSSTWFPMRTGDAVLFDSLTWHAGGANTSERRRTLLSASFVEAKRSQPAGGGERKLRLSELIT
jgi:ectoine hydroxylase-related dioxygenase (phytanoyl-CoA dioxygenase family)